MTRKRSGKSRVNPKKKWLGQLQTRLIRINIVIEDYLYGSARISPSEAQAYIEEVASYEAQGVDDPRCLQVMEKITRCMKAIIAEQQEDRKAFVETAAPEQNCPSPVYSLPDEDRTLSQAYLENIQDNKSQDIETVDLSNEEQDNVTICKNIQVDVEIHRAMSNLSIRNEEPVDCSQSILENFEPVGILKNHTNYSNITNNVHEINCGNNLSLKQTKLIEIKKPNIGVHKDITRNSVTKININDILIKKVNHKLDSKILLQNKENNSTAKCQTKQDIIEIDDDDSKKIEETNAQVKKSSKPKKNTPAPKKSKRNKVVRCPTKADKVKGSASVDKTKGFGINKRPIECKNSMSISKDSTSHNISHMNDTVNSYEMKTKSNNPIDLSKSMGKIYNKNIENDLSWVENIRYVREICNDEFDKRMALDEKFWDNFDVPFGLDENDFDY